MRHLFLSRLILGLLLVAVAGCTNKPQPAPIAEPTLHASSYRYLVQTLSSPEFEGRDAGSDGLELARDLMVNRFEELGLEPGFIVDGKPSYTQPFTIRTGKDEQDNVIEATVENVGALLPGVGDLKDEVLVIGAHYDHVGYGDIGSRAKDQRGQLHPGADDNASGTAGVLLLAKYFAQQHAYEAIHRRTIFFTGFSAEERGLLGARHMTRNPDQWAFDKNKITGMINMDMIGRLRNDELYIFTDATGVQWRDWINDANQDIGLNLKWDVRPPGGSDHSLFIAARIPAVFFNTWLHDDYHTPRDTADKINAEGSIQILKLIAALTERAVTVPQRITFVPPKPRPPRPYLGVKLGDADAGVLIEDVLDDGPMDKAGVNNGDVLLSMGRQAVNSPGDVRAFLAKAKAGTEVKIEVKRGDDTMQLTVLLGKR